MKRFRDLSIRVKLMQVIIATTLVALGISVLAILFYDQQSYKKRLALDTAMLADILADNTASAVAFDDDETAAEVLQSLSRNKAIEWATVLLPDGSRFAGYAADGLAEPRVIPYVEQGVPTFKHDKLFVASTIRANGSTVGQLVIGSNLNELAARLTWFLNMGLVIAILVTAVGLVIAFYFQRSLSRPLKQLARDAAQLSNGKLDLTVSYESQDEIGQLASAFRALIGYLTSLADAARLIADRDLTVRIEPRSEDDVLGNAFRSMVFNLIGMITKLQDSSQQLASAASEITSSAEQMSQGASHQSQQVAQVTAAIEEMTATIFESAKHAGQANDASRTASETASGGGTVVAETVVGMQRIANVVRESAETIGKLATSADQIGQIINVIDDIADQTNLLALNAAIEAARAGEQGRGFAVVADEVRKLAERTGKATAEISAMIKGIQTDTADAVGSMESGIKEVDHGRQLADQAGNSLQEIVAMSQQVMTMIQQIAEASEEQSSAAEQISQTIEQVATFTRETASGAEQSAASAEELNGQAESLKELISTFKI